MLSRRRKIVFAGLIALGALALLLITSCWFFNVWATQDAIGYYGMVGEHCHPVWKALAFRRFSRGDPVKKLTDGYPPLSVEEFPPYKALLYSERGSFNVLVVIARDDVLMSAFAESCTWAHHFFRMPPAEMVAFNLAHDRYRREEMIGPEVRRIEQARQEGRSVFIAAVGPLAYDSSEPISIRVLEQVIGLARIGEEIVPPPGKLYIRHGDVQDDIMIDGYYYRKVILVADKNGYYRSVSAEALERAKVALEP